MNHYPIGLNKEAQDFEAKHKHDILGWEADADYFLEEKTIKYLLKDRTKVEFTFPFSEIIQL